MAVIMRRAFGKAALASRLHRRMHRPYARAQCSATEDAVVPRSASAGTPQVFLYGGLSRPAGEKVNTSTPFGVTPTVCSNCADSERSRVTAVQPSDKHLHVRAAEIDHRLDREEHARLEHDAFAGPADMHDVRLVVEQAAEPVAAEIAHHAHVLRFDIGLDRVRRCRRWSRRAGSRRCRASSPRG